MTYHTTAAQAAKQEVVSDADLLRICQKFNPGQDLDLAKAVRAEVLSKLRAPVAGELPHWEEISAKLERDETLTPLELFIHENEPAGGDADAWRDQFAAALASAPVAGEADEEDATAAWRRLALQFDDHRMQALGHLRAMLADPQAHADRATVFLAAPPLSGEQVLAERIRALAAPQASEAVREPSSEAGPRRYVVLKAAGSRYAYVNDAQEGRTMRRFDVLKGDGWGDAVRMADRLNREHAAALSAQPGAQKDSQ